MARTAAVPDSVPEIGYTKMQEDYLYWRGMGLSPVQAARRAGYSDPSNKGPKLERNPKLKDRLELLFEAARERFDLSRDNVVGGLLEAIQVAKLTSDAASMIKGWSELARITGVEAPERKEFTLVNQPGGQLALPDLKRASDTELLQIVGKSRELSVIEDAEYVEIIEEKRE